MNSARSLQVGCCLSLLLLAANGVEAQERGLHGKWTLREQPTGFSWSGGRTPGDSTAAMSPDSGAADSSVADSVTTDSTESGRRSGGAQGGPRGRAAGDREGGGRRSRLSESDRVALQRLNGMAQPVSAFEIDQSDSAIVVTNDGGFTYTLYPDGEAHEMVLDDGLVVEVKTRWDGGHLIAEFKPESGGKLIETYSLADSGMYLRVDITVEHGRLPQPVWRSRMYRLES